MKSLDEICARLHQKKLNQAKANTSKGESTATTVSPPSTLCEQQIDPHNATKVIHNNNNKNNNAQRDHVSNFFIFMRYLSLYLAAYSISSRYTAYHFHILLITPQLLLSLCFYGL